MTEHEQQIERHLVQSASRERRLFVALAFFRLLSVLSIGLGVALLCVWWSVPRETGLVLAGMVCFGLGLFALSGPLARVRFKVDRGLQAGRIESVRPALRGRLNTLALTSVRGSEPLFTLLVARTLVALEGFTPQELYSGQAIHRSSRAALGLGLFNGALAVFWIGLPALSAWSFGATAGPHDAPLMADEQRVGDLGLTYEYPDYTGLETLEVSNSTGEVSAPPGTRVTLRLRTSGPVESASLKINDEPYRSASLSSDGRSVSAQLEVGLKSGSWRLRTLADELLSETRSFPIAVEPDLAPEVLLDADASFEVAVDEPLIIKWHARDDYGLSRVHLFVDGRSVGRAIWKVSSRKAEALAVLTMSPRQLGLSEGSRVKLAIGAWDNDAVSGTKLGLSREVVVDVLGPRGLREREDQRQRRARDVLVELLARTLVDPSFDSSTSDAITRWGYAFLPHLKPLKTELKAWAGPPLHTPEGKALLRTSRAGDALVRFSQVGFTPGDHAAPDAQELQTLLELRIAHRERVESTTLLLDSLIRNRALRTLVDQAKVLQRNAVRLGSLASSADVPAQRDAIDRVDTLLNEMSAQAEKLGRGGLRDRVKARSREMRSLISRSRQQMANAQPVELSLKRLSQQMTQLSESIEDALKSSKKKSDDRMQKAKDLLKELRAIEVDQLTNQRRTTALLSPTAAAEIKALWQQVGGLGQRWRADLSNYEAALKTLNAPFYEQQRAEEAVARVERMQKAIEARDLKGAEVGLSEATHALWRSILANESSVKRPGVLSADSGVALLQRSSDLEMALAKLRRSAGTTRMDKGDAQARASQQRDLQRRLKEARKAAIELVRDFPVKPERLAESLSEANEQMRLSEAALGRRNAVESQGAQGVASQRVREAREALEQAMKQAARQAQQLQEGGGEQASGAGEGDQEAEPPEAHLELEDAHSAEQYRRELMKGMEGEVSEAFRSHKRRYFEELMR